MAFSYTFIKHIVDMLQFENYMKDWNFEKYEYSLFAPETEILTMFFSAELTTNERNIISNAVDSFVEQTIEYETTCSNILTSPKSTNKTTWTQICSWNFPGFRSLVYNTLHMNSIIQKTNDTDTYSIRIFDPNHNTTICSFTASNEDWDMQMVDIDTNLLPSYISNLELHAKVSSPEATVLIKNFCITS